MDTEHKLRMSHSVRRRVVAAAAVLVLLVIGVAAWIGVRGALAKTELEQALPLATEVRARILDGDAAAAADVAGRLAERTATAAALTGDPVWRLAEVLPWIGDDLAAVRELGQVTDGLVADAIVPLAARADSIDPELFSPVEGRIPLQPIIDAQADVRRADTVLQSALARISAIDTGSLLPPVADAVDRLDGMLAEVSPGLDAVRRGVDLLPEALGADGPRRYLVVIQNPAEPRGSGGNPGALALIGTDGGRVSLLQQASTSDFPRFPEPVLDLDPDTAGLYGNVVGQYLQDVTMTPRFEQSAALAAKMWSDRFGTPVDGVLGLDPVALGHLLAATGPVQLPTGDSLTTDDAAALLLNEVYTRYPDPVDQDAFFAAASGAVFDRIASGAFDAGALVRALGAAAAERRVLLWSADPDEQAILAGTTLVDLLPTDADAARSFGVYVNDVTGSKLGYYLDLQTSTGVVDCGVDGGLLGLRIVVRNTAPADAASSLPDYVTGGGEYGVAPGDYRFRLALYAPPGSVTAALSRDGASLGAQPGVDGAFPVTQFVLTLAPGESTTIDLVVRSPDGIAGEGPQVVRTPLTHGGTTEHTSISCLDAK